MTTAPPPAWMAIISIYLIFIFLYRIQNEHIEGGIADELGQYTMAIKGMWQKSICPRLKSYGNIQGYYCYPLAFAWLCGQAGKNNLVKKVFSNLSNENSLFPNLEHKKAVELKASILTLKLLSGLVFPLAIQLTLILSCLFIGSFTLLSLIVGIGSSLIIDSVFTTQRYAISTRNVGYFLYLIFALALFNFIDLSSQSDTLIITGKLVLIGCVFFTSLLIHQCSQRSSQTFIILLVVSSILIPGIRIELLGTYLIAQLLLLQLPFSNYSEFIRSHFYNRIHDSEWTSRVYGHFRYGFSKILTGNALKSFKDDFFNLDFLDSHMTGVAYYKNNWLALFAVHRIYIYMAFITLLANDINNDILLPINIILVSTIVPSILCFLRPFQGYGSLEVYVWSNIPLAYFSCLPFLVYSMSSGTNMFSTCLIIIEIIYIISKGLWFRFKKLQDEKSKPIYAIGKSNFLDATATAFGASVHMNNITDFITSLSIGKLPFSVNSSELSIMALDMHPQSFIEVLAMYVNDISNCKIKLKPAFVQLDNLNYGFFQDYIQFFVNPYKIANVIKPDLLLIDSSRNASRNILNSFLKYKNFYIIFKSGSLVLLQMTNKISPAS